jgi:DNA-binding NtrC family response regulator
MSKRILSISYDISLLSTRRMLLEQRGYQVTSALGFTKALEACSSAHYDLFILGHSIPVSDKLALIETFRKHCNAPVVSLERPGEERVQCEFHVSPDDPEQLLEKVDGILKLLDTSPAPNREAGNARLN